MSPEVKQAIEKYCQDLIAHDAYMNREMCERILETVDYDAPGTLIQDGEYYEITATLQDGRSLGLGYIYGGWYASFGKPVQAVPA